MNSLLMTATIGVLDQEVSVGVFNKSLVGINEITK